jgi:hypothetical protein
MVGSFRKGGNSPKKRVQRTGYYGNRGGGEREKVRLVKKIISLIVVCLPSMAYGNPSIEFVTETHELDM